MKNSDRAWQIWGENDPYFGVVSHEEFSGGNNKDKFFASGKTWCQDILAKLERSFGELNRRRALDFGAGVGRLALAFADEFEEVIGLDISPGMLREATANAQALGKANAKFAISDDDLTQAPGQFDFVNTYIVLQHIPTERGLIILSKLIDKVAPGGGFHIHASIKRDMSAARRAAYWVKMNVPGSVHLVNKVTGFNPRGPAMQMNEYPVHKIMRVFNDLGISDVLVLIEDHSGVLTLSFLGRKPSA